MPSSTEIYKNPKLLARFKSKLETSLAANGDCLETKHKTARGYGKICCSENGKLYQISAHRLAYFLHFGKIEGELHICHTCDNPPCCNPEHLFQGTPSDNINDARMKGRLTFGERHPQAKIRKVEVEAICALRKCSFTTNRIAEIFGLSQGHITEITNGNYWEEPIKRESAEDVLRELIEYCDSATNTPFNYLDIKERAKRVLNRTGVE